MTHVGTTQIAPDDAKVYNPAFDVTPHRLITGIITERGVARAPYTESLQALFDAAEPWRRRAGGGRRALMRILGIESSCDETAAAVVAAPEGRPLADALEHRRLAGRDSP